MTSEITRVKRAREQDIEILERKDDEFLVLGTKGDKYTIRVDVLYGQHTCSCPDHVNRQTICKHIYHVLMEEYDIGYDKIVERVHSKKCKKIPKCTVPNCELCPLIYRGEVKEVTVTEAPEDGYSLIPPKASPILRTLSEYPKNPSEPEEISLEQPPLIRGLSEHHWKAAERTLVQNREQETWAGSYHPLLPGPSWQYWVSKAGNSIIRHSRSSAGVYDEKVVRWPRSLRCSAHVKKGKGKQLRCRKRCYDRYCAQHEKILRGPCSYIA